MQIYYLTAFEKNGEKILDEAIEAKNADEAKKIGERILEEKNLSNHTHRLVSPEGQLLLFHV
ncbi:YhzD family protein [Fervidibacillus halotolerans]|uniref:YhzD family protein n=1 Tax=Fervidibacillus halotolerans TaxID=2980027 RepID=A0A9E8M0B5_9BACI|nr:YhzD family protein [Fervidibacillus halotolerans]WAA13002.1 YhzD family protein [Fervidibacillus halotolerans]